MHYKANSTRPQIVDACEQINFSVGCFRKENNTRSVPPGTPCINQCRRAFRAQNGMNPAYPFNTMPAMPTQHESTSWRSWGVHAPTLTGGTALWPYNCLDGALGDSERYYLNSRLRYTGQHTLTLASIIYDVDIMRTSDTTWSDRWWYKINYVYYRIVFVIVYMYTARQANTERFDGDGL